MKVLTLERTVATPFELGAPQPLSAAPVEVQQHVAAGQPWHLVGWVDEADGTVGLCRKHLCMTVAWPVTRLVIGAMQRAKGPGVVALEASSAGEQWPIVMLRGEPHSEAALAWLTQRAGRFAEFFGAPVETQDWGHDC